MASVKDGKTIRLGLKSIALSKQSYNGPRQGHQSSSSSLFPPFILPTRRASPHTELGHRSEP